MRTSFCPAAASVPPSTAPAPFVKALLSWTAYRSYVAVSADRAIIALGAPAEVVEALPADSVSVIAFFSEGAALKSRSSVPAQRLPTTSTSAANAGTMARQRGRLVLFSTSFILLSSRFTAARQPVSNPAGTFSDWYRRLSACSKAPLGSFSRSMRMPPFLGNKRA